jgi:Kdo2-lipid IVA lauroyltransferase/acyltransferase
MNHYLFVLIKIIITFIFRIPCLIILFEKLAVILAENVIRYRKNVIEKNLKKSFPEMTEKEIRAIRHKYYRCMIRYIRESFQIGFGPESRIRKHIRVIDHKNGVLYPDGSTASILMASHYGNWEIVSLLPILFPEQRFIAFYKPVQNKLSSEIARHIRSRCGLQIHPISQTARIMAENAGKSYCYLFVGDQSPFNMNSVHWNVFLGQNTPWMTGAERLAIKYNIPVMYLQINPAAVYFDGPSYDLYIEIIAVTPAELPTGCITETYTRLLERQIMDKPEYWLWSHKRWKRAKL